MPLHLPGAIVLGPQATAAPTTLTQFLASIGKASWYALWMADQSIAPGTLNSLSTGLGSAVNTGEGCGRWSPWLSLDWTGSFIQPTSSSRPLYSTTLSTVGPTVSGNGASWSMFLDSTIALNRDCTILMAFESVNATGFLFTQNTNQWSYYTQLAATNNNANNVLHTYSNVQEVGDGCVRAETSESTGTWTRRRRLAISSGASTARYNNALRLFGTSSTYFAAHRISSLAFVPKLTSGECARALMYLV